MEKVGKLKRMRLRRELSQTAAAAEIRISAPMLSLLESGARVPSFGVFRRMRKVYDVDAGPLFDAIEEAVLAHDAREAR